MSEVTTPMAPTVRGFQGRSSSSPAASAACGRRGAGAARIPAGEARVATCTAAVLRGSVRGRGGRCSHGCSSAPSRPSRDEMQAGGAHLRERVHQREQAAVDLGPRLVQAIVVLVLALACPPRRHGCEAAGGITRRVGGRQASGGGSAPPRPLPPPAACNTGWVCNRIRHSDQAAADSSPAAHW